MPALVEFQLRGLRETQMALRTLTARWGNMGPALTAAAEALMARNLERFDEQVDPAGRTWAPFYRDRLGSIVTDSRGRRYYANDYPGAANNRGRWGSRFGSVRDGDTLLQETGRLRESIQVQQVGPDTVLVRSVDPKAKYHQDTLEQHLAGGSDRLSALHPIPERAFLGINEEDNDAVFAAFVAAFTGGA